MPGVKFIFVQRPNIKPVKLTLDQVRELTQFADDLMDRRVDTAGPINIFGEPRPALSEEYAKRKVKEFGGRPVRDMRRTGQTLAAKQVYGEMENESTVSAFVGIRGKDLQKRALWAQNVDPWFGLTDAEESQVRVRGFAMFAKNVADAGGK